MLRSQVSVRQRRRRTRGHSDLTTTLAYLEGEDVRSEERAQKVDETFGVFA
jgi:hypothetical protein